MRDGVQICEGGSRSLKRFKDDVREVQTGFECGIGLDGYNDVKVGDVIEPFEIEETRGDALMIVGAAVVELHVHGSQSLKEKRGVVRSIAQRLRNRFNVVGRGDRRAGHLAARRARHRRDGNRSRATCGACSTGCSRSSRSCTSPK